jgi:excisionase family DNA binding protein
MATASKRVGAPGPYRTAMRSRQAQRPRDLVSRSRPAIEEDAEVLLRTTEVARRLQVSARTVLAWAQAGKLPSILTPGGHRRYPAQGVEDVLAAMTAAGDERIDGPRG